MQIKFPYYTNLHSFYFRTYDFGFSMCFKYFIHILFVALFTFQSNRIIAQCVPNCQLEGVGMYMWMGDSDGQSLGDITTDDEDGDDFIVYRNYGTTAVNISGWELYTDVKGLATPVFTFPSRTILQPGQTATVVADWNPGPSLPTGWFDAGFNVGGEGMFEEVANNLSFAILKNPVSNQYIVVHQQGASSTGATLSSGTKICNYNATSLIPLDFEGCQSVFWNFNTCDYVKITDCTLSFLKSCLAGTSRPTLSSNTIANVCPANTVNLNAITATNKPQGTFLTWHTSTPATSANKLTNAQASAQPAGTYYAAFYDGTNCYSGTNGSATSVVTATTNSCSTVAGTINCSKSVIYAAPIADVSGQHVLRVIINVTSTGVFTPISVSGSGMSVANNVSSLAATSTGVKTFYIPILYDGSALGVMNFTVGPAGSCSADLTKIPKKSVSDVWSLDCLPTVGPSLK